MIGDQQDAELTFEKQLVIKVDRIDRDSKRGDGCRCEATMID